MNDHYSHIDSTLIYVLENIPGPTEDSKEYAELLNNLNSQLTACECNDKCIQDTCSCLQNTGGTNYTVCKDTGTYILSDKDFKTYSIIECNSLCSCSAECGNRIVQKGPRENLIIKNSEDKGLGLFTINKILKGAFICKYAGEVITKTQALKRQERNQLAGRMNYIYCLNEHSNKTVTQTFIDPSCFGNVGRYMNHSCEPNCYIIPVRVDTPTAKLAIFSCSDIAPDTELTFDYGSHLDNSILKGNKIADINNRKKCSCNSLKCRQLMPFDIY